MLVTKIEGELRDDGWTISWSESPLNFKIVFKHPLVDEFGAVAKPEASIDSFENLIRHVIEDNRDFQLVHDRPRQLEHPEAMRLIRLKATVARWDDQDIQHVCYLLLALGQLTEDEADWVMRSGPAMEMPA